MERLICLLLIVIAFGVSLSACSKSTSGEPNAEVRAPKTPEDAINFLITAYAKNDLDMIHQTLGSHHRFGSNIIDGMEWLGNCLTIMDQCIKRPVQVLEIKQVGNEVAVAVMAKNLMGAPMSVWFITVSENDNYKVTGMNTRCECALKTPEQKAKDREERKPGDYSFC